MAAQDGLVFAKRLYGFLDAVKRTVRSQHLIDAEPRHRGLRADRFEASNRKIDAVGVAFANEIDQDLGCGKVDLDDARCLQHDQPSLPRRGLQGILQVSAELIGVEKGQWRLKSGNDD